MKLGMSLSLWIIGTVVVSVLIIITGVSLTTASQLTIEHTFVAGDVARAADVNSNFLQAKIAVDDNDARISALNTCPTDMIQVGPICIDQFEASVWNAPDATATTQYGVMVDDYPCLDNGNDCSSTSPIFARSVSGVRPSQFATWFQAQQACAMSGKRLPTNAEWQMAAAGTPDPAAGGDGTTTCNTIVVGTVPTGTTGDCNSNWGVADMVGNIWEWVGDWVQGPNGGGSLGSWEPHSTETSTDTFGVDTVKGMNESAPTAEGFPAALIRGGAFDSGAGAGVFATNANFGPASSENNIGFRCVL